MTFNEPVLNLGSKVKGNTILHTPWPSPEADLYHILSQSITAKAIAALSSKHLLSTHYTLYAMLNSLHTLLGL